MTTFTFLARIPNLLVVSLLAALVNLLARSALVRAASQSSLACPAWSLALFAFAKSSFHVLLQLSLLDILLCHPPRPTNLLAFLLSLLQSVHTPGLMTGAEPFSHGLFSKSPVSW